MALTTPLQRSKYYTLSYMILIIKCGFVSSLNLDLMKKPLELAYSYIFDLEMASLMWYQTIDR